MLSKIRLPPPNRLLQSSDLPLVFRGCRPAGYYRRGHRIYLIQVNASYHRHPEVWEFFKQERSKLEVFSLPKYSPELNAQEPLWKDTRSNSTNNRLFETPADLCSNLFHTFDDSAIRTNSWAFFSGLLTPICRFIHAHMYRLVASSPGCGAIIGERREYRCFLPPKMSVGRRVDIVEFQEK